DGGSLPVGSSCHVWCNIEVALEPTDLAGAWEFTRRIDDRLAVETTNITGNARFTTGDDARVKWEERGVWERPTGPVPVQRTLWIEPRDGGWFVTFEDGRDFHTWTTDRTVEHPCGSDTYRGVVTPGVDESRWTLEWVARGPEKDYTMRTSYTRP
ncbi:MAG: DUF6314 family protein, partial [Nocardioides sp.]|nr:DUF6314 family protein [Nocardioides sp.]